MDMRNRGAGFKCFVGGFDLFAGRNGDCRRVGLARNGAGNRNSDDGGDGHASYPG